MDDDPEIFPGKKFSDLCKDIYDNAEHTRNQIGLLISKLQEHCTDVNSALMLIPEVKSLLDSGIKNDDQLVKLASIYQRILAKTTSANDPGAYQLTDEERRQLMETVEAIAEEQTSIDETINTIETHATRSSQSQ
jgi:hypothetical protein